MQAIVSDIIVSQAVQNQNGSLLVSQTLNSNSSNESSFAQMLSSLNKTQEQNANESAQKTDAPAYKEPERAEPVENSKEPDKSERIKDEKLVKQDEKPAVSKEENAGEKAPASKLNKQAAIKNSEAAESKKEPLIQENDKTENPKLIKKDAKLQSEDKKTDSKKVLTDEEKKAAIEKQNLDVIISESMSDASEEVAKNAAPVDASMLKTEVIDNEKLGADSVQDIELNNLAVKAEEKPAVELNPKEKISVIDMRTKVEQEAEEKPVEKNPKSALKVEYNSSNSATVTMEMSEQAAVENMISLDSQTAASNGSDFQAMVSNQIQANAPEFVKTGTILLRDNDKGTINLVLHPDDLGNVKIHLSMDGKTISAHITVNTKEALEVFKENAQTLREAFAKNGYETASFDVSYNGNSNGQQNNQDFQGRYDGMEYIARTAYRDYEGGSNDGYIQEAVDFSKNSEYSINIVA